MRNKRLVRNALRWSRVSGAFYKTWAALPSPIAVSVLSLLVILAQAGEAVNAESLPDADLARGSVLVEMFEQGVPVEAKWPQSELEASDSYAEEALALFRLPQRYVDTGVPAGRANPLLVRASATVDLPAGEHRILLRAHRAARLWMNQKIVAELPFPEPISDGHDPVQPPTSALVPGLRLLPAGDREMVVAIATEAGEHHFVLEAIAGGRRGGSALRLELGETSASICLQGEQTFVLLSPDRTIPLTDEAWHAFAAERNDYYDQMEAERRADTLSEHQDYWKQRHERARQVVNETPAPQIPDVSVETPVNNPIDRFLGHRIEQAHASAGDRSQGIDFHRQILPLLEDRCISCHGTRPQGGLRLDRRDSALEGGDSGQPPWTAGDSEHSLLIERIRSDDELERMPPQGEPLTQQELDRLAQWIDEGAVWPDEAAAGDVSVPPLTDDLTFLRRVTLDTVGMVPSLQEIEAFLADEDPDRRARVIDRLLDDPRWADHWVSYWQDVLAENPSIINPTLNNTGPFRWWLYESLLDNKPLDLLVTELIRMRGSVYDGGPAGFSLATQNDVPMAEKAGILTAAFLGKDMKCARCHDAPFHHSTQEQLFSLAAMLEESPIHVPASSSVPPDKLGHRPLIEVNLPPGSEVPPRWPLDHFVSEEDVEDLMPPDATGRDRLAVLITSAENERFAQVIVNRIWQRLMGRGLVEPVDDWESAEPSHPELLAYLARELVLHDYDQKHVARLILNSHAYQREARRHEPSNRLFAAPLRRQKTAEQLVDSLFASFGQPLDTEPLNFDLNSGRSVDVSLNLGRPRRAWQFASTSTDRDRASLVLPRVQAVVDVLVAFGWRPSRQEPISCRETPMTVLQPAILANGTMSIWLTRLCDDSEITRLCLEEIPLEKLIETVFLRILTRPPTDDELDTFQQLLGPGFGGRIVADVSLPVERKPQPYVTWANHLEPEADEIKVRQQQEARAGQPPTPRLDEDWRMRMEDMLWALLNSPEIVLVP